VAVLLDPALAIANRFGNCPAAGGTAKPASKPKKVK
jgi:hypothetical protein